MCKMSIWQGHVQAMEVQRYSKQHIEVKQTRKHSVH